MLITNILTNQTPVPPPPGENGTQTETQTSTSESETPQGETTQSAETEKAASVARPAKGGTQEATVIDVAPRLSPAMDEAFARAAALRTLEGLRTRALIDMISPIDTSRAKVAKSYLSLVEPKEAVQANGEGKTPRKTAPLDRAA